MAKNTDTKKYMIVIHYEGAYVTRIEADSVDAAKEIAVTNFEALDAGDFNTTMEYELVDCWETNTRQ